MQAFQGFRQALVVASEKSKASCPAEGPFSHPTAWQEHEAFLGLWQLDDLEANAPVSGGLFSLRAGVALVHKNDFDRLAGLRQVLHHLLLLARWRDTFSGDSRAAALRLYQT